MSSHRALAMLNSKSHSSFPPLHSPPTDIHKQTSLLIPSEQTNLSVPFQQTSSSTLLPVVSISKKRTRNIDEKKLIPSFVALLDIFTTLDTLITLLKKRGRSGLGPSLISSASLPQTQVVITKSSSRIQFITLKSLQDEMAVATSRSFGPEVLRNLIGIAPESFIILCARIGTNGEAIDGPFGVRNRAEELLELPSTFNQHEQQQQSSSSSSSSQVQQSKKRLGIWQHVIDINPFWPEKTKVNDLRARRDAFEDLLYEFLNKSTILPEGILPSLSEIPLDISFPLDVQKSSTKHLSTNDEQEFVKIKPEESITMPISIKNSISAITQEDVDIAIANDPELKGMSFSTIARMLEKERTKEDAKKTILSTPFGTMASRSTQRDLLLLPQVFDAVHDALFFPPPKRRVEYMRILSEKVCRSLGEKGFAISELEFRDSVRRLVLTDSLALDWGEIKLLPVSSNKQSITSAPSALSFSSGRSSSAILEDEKDREIFRLSQDVWSGKISKKYIADRISSFVKGLEINN